MTGAGCVLGWTTADLRGGGTSSGVALGYGCSDSGRTGWGGKRAWGSPNGGAGGRVPSGSAQMTPTARVAAPGIIAMDLIKPAVITGHDLRPKQAGDGLRAGSLGWALQLATECWPMITTTL